MFIKSKNSEIYFDELLIYCEFSTDYYEFSGHIQKINQKGVSVILMNNNNIIPSGISGYLKVFCGDDSYKIFCKLNWVDSSNQFIRYCIATMDIDSTHKFLSECFPEFSFS